MSTPFWDTIKEFTGNGFDSMVESNYKGTFRVTTENVENGNKTVKLFRGTDAKNRAIEWASTVKAVPPKGTDINSLL